MEQIMNYIRPELLVLIPVLYFIGVAMKQSQRVKDNWIPAILGVVGVLLSILYVLATFCYQRLSGGSHGRIYRPYTGNPLRRV